MDLYFIETLFNPRRLNIYRQLDIDILTNDGDFSIKRIKYFIFVYIFNDITRRLSIIIKRTANV